MHENGVRNFLHVRLSSEHSGRDRKGDGRFSCCDSLPSVDSAVDAWAGQIEGELGRYSRDVRCILAEYEMCSGRVAGDG